MDNLTNETYSGRVIFYDKNKGFGRIEHPEFGEVFLHQSKMEEGFKVAHKNDLLSFEVVPSTRKKGVYEAMNVKFILNENLDVLKDSLANKVTIQGKVLNMNAGGLLMDILGIEVFLPKSEVDVYEFNFGSAGLNQFAGKYMLQFCANSVFSACYSCDTASIQLIPAPTLTTNIEPAICNKNELMYFHF